MFLLQSNAKSWVDMTQGERNVILIMLGIMVLGLIGYGIYYYFKNKKNKKDFANN